MDFWLKSSVVAFLLCSAQKTCFSSKRRRLKAENQFEEAISRIFHTFKKIHNAKIKGFFKFLGKLLKELNFHEMILTSLLTDYLSTESNFMFDKS